MQYNTNDQLKGLQEQMARQRQLTAQLESLRAQRGQLERHVQELDQIRLKETNDVEKLEGAGLSALFYSLLGKKEERLGKERAEAYSAVVKYNAALRELRAVEDYIESVETELGGLAGCERAYNQLLEERARQIKASGSETGKRIFNLEERLGYLQAQLREVDEALAAGSVCQNTVDAILDRLGSAEGWGTFDLLGGGLLSDIAKHSHLDEAQRLVEELQIQLRRFKTELADVTIRTDMQVQIDGFLRFADYFFDGIFADWAVLDRIERAQHQVLDTRSQISETLRQLAAMQSDMEGEYAGLKDELDSLIIGYRPELTD